MGQPDNIRKLQVQGIHHMTLVGADRQSTIDFWEGVLGMPLVLDQPNPNNADQAQLFFDPGDGRLITVFTNEARRPDPARTSTEPGAVHHLAFSVSQAALNQAAARLAARGIAHSPAKDRGFMKSIYFHDPLGLLIELACYKFDPPTGCSHADVLREAHRISQARGASIVLDDHLADAIERLVARTQPSLSPDRGPRNPY